MTSTRVAKPGFLLKRLAFRVPSFSIFLNHFLKRHFIQIFIFKYPQRLLLKILMDLAGLGFVGHVLPSFNLLSKKRNVSTVVYGEWAFVCLLSFGLAWWVFLFYFGLVWLLVCLRQDLTLQHWISSHPPVSASLVLDYKHDSLGLVWGFFLIFTFFT